MLDDTAGAGADITVGAPDRFLAAVARFGAQPAVCAGETIVSYAALADRVRRMAGAIRRRGERARVVIAVPPGADAYAAMLATAMAGGVYAPLNKAAPVAKQRAICARFDPDLIIADPAAWQLLADTVPRATQLDPAAFDAGGRSEGEPPLAAPVPARDRHPLAYVIFTSGSTGKPKGVEISRASLDHYIAWLGHGLDIRPGDRVSQFANIAFDLSVMEIFGALCHGASLHPPCGNSDRIFPAGLMRRERLTHWVSVPSVISLMRQAGELTAEHASTVRRFVFCGEPLTPAHVDYLLHAAPASSVQNTYGPTEATVSVTSVLLTADDLPCSRQPTVALGAPIPGMDVRLIGGPHDDEGEIVLLGPQLARGYVGDADATAAAFRTLSTESGPQRAYHTGDWARRVDGRFYFLARSDSQIKHKGFRIELGEIQSALATSGCNESVVFVSGGKLVAVVEADVNPSPPDRLRQALRLVVEPHAVPDVIVSVQQLPRNENGKIDRAASIALFASPGKAAGRGLDDAGATASVVIPPGC